MTTGQAIRRATRSLLLRASARRMAPARAPAAPSRRILLIRPDHLGDLLFLTPALRALRRARPEATLIALVGPWAAPLLAGSPDVDRVETLDFPWFDRAPRGGALEPYRRLHAAAVRLRTLQIDTAIVCRFDHWWGAMLAAAAGTPRIIGYDLPDLRPFLTTALPYEPGRHEVIQNARLMSPLGVAPTLDPARDRLHLTVTAEARERARHLLAEPPPPTGSGPRVGIHPGSGAAVKRWGIEAWRALMHALHQRHGAHFVVTGGPGEERLAAEVAAGSPAAISVAGRTDLITLTALFERCALVVGPDSGPLHLAVAAGRPTVHLYGPVSPRLFGPWGPPARHRVVHQSLACQFCERLDWDESALPHHPCVRSIPTARVLAAAEALLTRPNHSISG